MSRLTWPIITLLSVMLASCGGASGVYYDTWQRQPDGGTWLTYVARVRNEGSERVVALASASRYGLNPEREHSFDYAFPPQLNPGERTYLLASRLFDEQADREDGQHTTIRTRAVRALEPEIPLLVVEDVVLEREDGQVRLSFSVSGRWEGRGDTPLASAADLVVGIIFHDQEGNPLGGLAVNEKDMSIAAGEKHTFVIENAPVAPRLLTESFRAYAYDQSLLPDN